MHLCQEELLVIGQQPFECWKFVGDFEKAISGYNGCHTSYLYRNVVEGQPVVQCVTSTELAVFADHSGLDGIASSELDDARYDAGVRKINSLDPPVGFGEHLGTVQLDHRKVRRYPVQRFRLKPV